MQTRHEESRTTLGDVLAAASERGRHIDKKGTEVLRRALLDQKRSLLRRHREALDEEKELLAEREPDWEDPATTQPPPPYSKTCARQKEAKSRAFRQPSIESPTALTGRAWPVNVPSTKGGCTRCPTPIDAAPARARARLPHRDVKDRRRRNQKCDQEMKSGVGKAYREDVAIVAQWGMPKWHSQDASSLPPYWLAAEAISTTYRGSSRRERKGTVALLPAVLNNPGPLPSAFPSTQTT